MLISPQVLKSIFCLMIFEKEGSLLVPPATPLALERFFCCLLVALNLELKLMILGWVYFSLIRAESSLNIFFYKREVSLVKDCSNILPG